MFLYPDWQQNDIERTEIEWMEILCMAGGTACMILIFVKRRK
jgi:hypothetical protein